MNWTLLYSARHNTTPTGRQTIWAAVSRTGRSPVCFDADASTPFIIGDGDFDSENVIGYGPDAEVGS